MRSSGQVHIGVRLAARHLMAAENAALKKFDQAHLHEHCEGRIAVASGADRFKVEMILKQVGLHSFFEGRIFSGHEMPRSKPHPDVYLAAAAHLQVDPTRCLVVEDTTVGITAGVAAGATVWAYAAAPAAHEPLLQAGAARVFTGMHALRLA